MANIILNMEMLLGCVTLCILPMFFQVGYIDVDNLMKILANCQGWK